MSCKKECRYGGFGDACKIYCAYWDLTTKELEQYAKEGDKIAKKLLKQIEQGWY